MPTPYPFDYYTTTTELTFGKYVGKTVQEVYDIKPTYIAWAIKTVWVFYIPREEIRKLGKNAEYIILISRKDVIEELERKEELDEAYDNQDFSPDTSPSPSDYGDPFDGEYPYGIYD